MRAGGVEFGRQPEESRKVARVARNNNLRYYYYRPFAQEFGPSSRARIARVPVCQTLGVVNVLHNTRLLSVTNRIQLDTFEKPIRLRWFQEKFSFWDPEKF